MVKFIYWYRSMFSRTALLWGCLLILPVTTALIAKASNGSTAYKFRHLTGIDGLSSKWVKCLYRDTQGFLWIGTAEGLNRYDGIKIKVYKFSLNDSTSINHNFISSIFEDKEGNLWIGTQLGLNRYVREKDCFHRIRWLNNYVSSAYELPHATMLIGSAGGLFVFNYHNEQVRQVNNNIGIESIVSTGRGRVWAGSRNGLFLIDTHSYDLHRVDLPAKNVRIRCLYVDTYNQLWIGTENHGIFIIVNPNDSLAKYIIRNIRYSPIHRNGISEGTVYAITHDPQKNLWIGIENGGINIISYDELTARFPRFIHLDHNPFDSYTLGNNSIHSLYCDKQGIMWVGTYGNGLSYTHPLLQKFEHYRQVAGTSSSINNNFVNALYDEELYTYVGTEGGLNVLDKRKGTFSYFTCDPHHVNSLSSNVVWSIYRDSHHNLWVGTWNGGLNLWNDRSRTFTRINFFPSDSALAANSVTKIMESSDGLLWVATMGQGLFCYNYKTNAFTQYSYKINQNSLSCNWLFDIVEDARGNIWIASTEAVDVFERSNNRFKKYVYDPANPASISYNGALVLFRDSKNHIWIGTSNGLNVYNEANDGFKCYYETDGLANSCIKAICEDDRGNLWISTNKGISKFINGSQIPDNPIFINYTVSDGLQGDEFNARSAFKNKQGYLFFGGPNGYNVFHPDSLHENEFIPPVIFTNLYIFNRLVRPGDGTGILPDDISKVKEIVLKKHEAVFTIEFAALNLIAPEKNQYAYYLEGIDKTWNYISNRHSVTYSYLPPGHYVLRVKASNNDGRWNETGTMIRITILPAWWESTLAKIIYAILILLALYFFRKYTLISVHLKNQLWLEHQEKQKIEELGRLKMQFFTNISHELRTPLTLILGPLKRMIDEGKDSEPLNTVYRNAFRLKTLVDQILDFNKIENEMMKLQWEQKDIVAIVLSTLKNFEDFAQHKGISLFFESNVSTCTCKIDEDKLEKIITNLISNAIKNTPAGGEVKLLLQYHNEHIILIVSDTGQGIAPQEIKHIFERFFTSTNTSITKPGTGIGLNLTHKLVEMLGGTIRVDSELGKGTTFTIQLPAVELSVVEKNVISIQLCASKSAKTGGGKRELQPAERPKVLVVDDDEEMGMYLQSILASRYQIQVENDATQALHRVNQFLPDIIISDVMMAGIDGYEFCARIKDDMRYCHIPVILLTARNSLPDQIQGYQTGADDYISKPFEESLLIARIENLLAKKERIRRQLITENGDLNRNAEISSLDYAFMEKLMQVIRQHYSNPDFDVNDIVDKMGISRSVLYSKLKSLSNQSISEIITNYRLQKSTELLQKSNMSISEVAMECGFYDPAYFSRVFKQRYGISPKAFRDESKTNNV